MQMKTLPFIFHHKDVSPYSEKVRLMLGYTGMSWLSVQAPLTPPRPSIDPLVGGYRRIPVAQVGADLFCDTRIICDEIAARTAQPCLSPFGQPEAVTRFIEHVETRVFMTGVASVPLAGLFRALWQQVPLRHWARYLGDKRQLLDSSAVVHPDRATSRSEWRAHLKELDARLETAFLGGTSPTIVDFCAVHLLWFREGMDGQALFKGLHRVPDWYQRMKAIGHGEWRAISAVDALAAAREALPREVPALMRQAKGVGEQVEVVPEDYACIPTRGVLVGEDAHRWILARDTEVAGRVHVHFPKRHYRLIAPR